jgi:hypothetical protein
MEIQVSGIFTKKNLNYLLGSYYIKRIELAPLS